MTKKKIVQLIFCIFFSLVVISSIVAGVIIMNNEEDKLSSQDVLKITVSKLDTFFGNIRSESNLVQDTAMQQAVNTSKIGTSIADYNQGLTDDVAYTFMDYCVDNTTGHLSMLKIISELENIEENKFYKYETTFQNDKFIYIGSISNVSDTVTRVSLYEYWGDIDATIDYSSSALINFGDYYITHNNKDVLSFAYIDYEKHETRNNYGTDPAEYYYYISENTFDFSTNMCTYAVIGYAKNEDLTSEQLRNEMLNMNSDKLSYVQNSYVSSAQGKYSEGNIIKAENIDGFRYRNASDITLEMVQSIVSSFKNIQKSSFTLPAESEITSIQIDEAEVYTLTSSGHGKDANGNYYISWTSNKDGSTKSYYLIKV